MPDPPAPERSVLRARYDYRQRIVIADAAHAFAERGFHGTSMQDLVVATGLTSGGLYHYFKNKDDLLILICDALMEPLLTQAREIVASDRSIEEQLYEIVRTWMIHVEENRDHMLVFQQERHVLENGDQWEHVRRQRKEFEQLLAGVLERGEREGHFQFRDRALALRGLLGMVNYTAQWFTPDGRLTPEEIADGYVDLLLGRRRRLVKRPKRTAAKEG